MGKGEKTESYKDVNNKEQKQSREDRDKEIEDEFRQELRQAEHLRLTVHKKRKRIITLKIN